VQTPRAFCFVGKTKEGELVADRARCVLRGKPRRTLGGSTGGPKTGRGEKKVSTYRSANTFMFGKEQAFSKRGTKKKTRQEKESHQGKGAPLDSEKGNVTDFHAKEGEKKGGEPYRSGKGSLQKREIVLPRVECKVSFCALLYLLKSVNTGEDLGSNHYAGFRGILFAGQSKKKRCFSVPSHSFDRDKQKFQGRKRGIDPKNRLAPATLTIHSPGLHRGRGERRYRIVRKQDFLFSQWKRVAEAMSGEGGSDRPRTGPRLCLAQKKETTPLKHS